MIQIEHKTSIRSGDTLIVSSGRSGQFVSLDIRQEPQPCGSLSYPFLTAFNQWEIHTMPVTTASIMPDGIYPSLRLVREKKVVDILIPTDETYPVDTQIPGLEEEPDDFQMSGLPTKTFLNQLGLEIDMSRGAAIVSKRLSRLFSPYRYWIFLEPEKVNIVHDPALDAKLWDGCGLMSRDFLNRQLDTFLATVPDHLQARYRRELNTTQRFEITLMHKAGQEKGDVLVVDDLNCDFLFPAGSSKREVRLNGRIFIGLSQPRHGKREMKLDVQSLINHHRFFSSKRLLTWLKQESDLFLANLQNGETDALLNKLLHTDSADALTRLESWWLGSYFASGGRAMWFAGVVQALARQRLKQLQMQINQKHRFPIPGARLYLFPASVGQRDVPSGQVELDFSCATAFVADEDWLTYLVPVLGGCDGDDAVWTFAFRDWADGQKKILLWRSPNQDGEYVLLQPTDVSDDIANGETLDNGWPWLDSRNLSPRIDTVSDIVYGTLPPAVESTHEEGYTIGAMTPAIESAVRNQGALGMYVNVQMVTKAIFGRVPRYLPARLEAVIDGMVKTGVDLTAVKAYCYRAAEQIARQKHPVSTGLAPRIEGMTKQQLQRSNEHWFDQLIADAQAHLAEFETAVDELCHRCCPPQPLFELGDGWREPAKAMLKEYNQAAHRAGTDPIARQETAVISQRHLAQWAGHEAELFAGLVCHLYSGGLPSPTADNILFQSDKNLEMDSVTSFLWALRELGILGVPVWENGRSALADGSKEMLEGIPVTFRGVWFNWLRKERPLTPAHMGDVSKETAQWAKTQLTEQVNQFLNMSLTVRVLNDR